MPEPGTTPFPRFRWKEEQLGKEKDAKKGD
jgi:hypothetical protein